MSHLTLLCLIFSTSKGVGWFSSSTVLGHLHLSLCWDLGRLSRAGLLGSDTTWELGVLWAARLLRPCHRHGAECRRSKGRGVKFAQFHEALIFLLLFLKEGFYIFYGKMWTLNMDFEKPH